MERNEIVNQSIIDAAKKLIQQYGFSKTTMEDIAKAAGKGKSTLYHYYTCKDEIFDEVISQEIDDFFTGVKKAVDKAKGPIEKLKTYIVVKIKTLKQRLNLYRFAFETASPSIDINKEFSKLRERYDHEETMLIASILKQGVENKLFRFSDKNDIDVLAELLVTCVRGVEMEVITKNKYTTLANKADMLVSIIAKGLS
ncbi:MAG: TetR/AcrR family transcriptional regulator [Lacibacter sp.]|jgi:AcrR family transcriptional regulator